VERDSHILFLLRRTSALGRRSSSRPQAFYQTSFRYMLAAPFRAPSTSLDKQGPEDLPMWTSKPGFLTVTTGLCLRSVNFFPLFFHIACPAFAFAPVLWVSRISGSVCPPTLLPPRLFSPRPHISVLPGLGRYPTPVTQSFNCTPTLRLDFSLFSTLAGLSQGEPHCAGGHVG